MVNLCLHLSQAVVMAVVWRANQSVLATTQQDVTVLEDFAQAKTHARRTKGMMPATHKCVLCPPGKHSRGV